MNHQPFQPAWLDGKVFVYQLSDCGIESHWGDLNLRYSAYSEQGVSWRSGNLRVKMRSTDVCNMTNTFTVNTFILLKYATRETSFFVH